MSNHPQSLIIALSLSLSRCLPVPFQSSNSSPPISCLPAILHLFPNCASRSPAAHQSPPFSHSMSGHSSIFIPPVARQFPFKSLLSLLRVASQLPKSHSPFLFLPTAYQPPTSGVSAFLSCLRVASTGCCQSSTRLPVAHPNITIFHPSCLPVATIVPVT